jgi:hypothetical protein
VRGINTPPVISSVPPTQGGVGQLYAYAVQGTDADGDALRYLLPALPAGMAIDPVTGAIHWTPDQTQVGSHDVVVGVTDDQGGNAMQAFTIVVAPAPVNQPPNIVSSPTPAAAADQPYVYVVEARDPENDVLTFTLSAAPAGMAIDAASGIINWVPAATEIGTHRVTVAVSDGVGNVARQTYALKVQAANQPPQVTSTAPTAAVAGAVYRWQLPDVPVDEGAARHDDRPAGSDHLADRHRRRGCVSGGGGSRGFLGRDRQPGV